MEYRILKKTDEDNSVWYYVQVQSKFLWWKYWLNCHAPGEDYSYISTSLEGAEKLLATIIKNRKIGGFPKKEVIKQAIID